MSMTREEAIVQIQGLKKYCEDMADSDESGTYVFDLDVQALDLALFSLRPVSREQVEKMKKAPVEGEYDELYAPTYKCPECGFWNTGRGNFCRNCGCLHTDKAVQMVMERLEALKDAGD